MMKFKLIKDNKCLIVLNCCNKDHAHAIARKFGFQISMRTDWDIEIVSKANKVILYVDSSLSLEDNEITCISTDGVEIEKKIHPYGDY